MYVAPLNLDLFFKKVFSNKHVAQKFLEDLLGVKITEMKLLSVEKKLTDAAVTVKFDFRCKINGQYVVIEMQQRYKVDVVKRFFLYHAVSTALQLETLKPIKVVSPTGAMYTEKNYSTLEPVLTVIWMVDDMLGFEDDFIVFTTLPESAKDFILDDNLWQQPLGNILEKREKTVKILQNKTKELDFFTQNKMIYVFQKNIVKNNRINLPYFKWFDIADLSRNPNNIENDFSKYKDDKDMAEVLNRIRKDKLAPEEFVYVSDLYNYDIYMARMEEDFKETIKLRDKRLAKIEQKVEQAEQKIEQAEQKIEQAEQKVEQEKQKVEQEKQKAELAQNRLLKSIKMLLQQGETIPSIADFLEISVEETTELIGQVHNS
jgi:hypothetical protein